MSDTERFHKLDRLFQAVCDLPTEQVRDRLIELAPDDELLRSEVLELLYAESDSGSNITPEAFQSSIQQVLAESTQDPDEVGNYMLIRRLGEGGMGVVYEARQQNPERTVALKLLKPGLASPELIRRFEFETRALGRLQHPGIAHIYEAGVTESTLGPRPYFAMEMIEGQTLSQWAKTSKPTPREKLELAAKICDAVQHAHSKGVVHRDLKPSNILVTKEGAPKVLDFGVARTVEDDHAELESMNTRPGQLVGTMPYMSPEQLDSKTEEVDTRSDVYSMGVVLYELLSGELPNKVEGLGLVDAAREIQNKQAEKLSTYNTRYRGDIETIVTTALAKDRKDRYQTVAALADDIRRYLADETISARPPSAVYQLSRFAKRNKLLVGLSCAFVAGMIIAVVGTSYAMMLAEQRLEESQRQVRISEAVTSFLNNDVLAAVAPSAQGHTVTVLEALDEAAEKLDERFAGEPATKAAISNNIGNVYLVLGEFAKAEPLITEAAALFQEALGPTHDLTLWAQRDQAMLLKDTARFEEAMAILEPLQQSVILAQGPTSELALNTVLTSAEVKAGMGDFESCRELLDLYEERRQGVLGDDDASVLYALMCSAQLDLELGRPAQAEKTYRKIYEIRLETDGPENQGTLIAEHNVATSLEGLGRYEEALPHYQHVYEVSRRTAGPDNPDILVTAHNLAFLYQSMGRFDEAEPLIRDTLERCHKVFGPVHPGTLTCTSTMASLLRETDRVEEAADLLADTYETARVELDAGSPALIELESNYAIILTDLDRYEDAEQLLVRCVPVMQEMYQGPHPKLASSLRAWGVCQARIGESVEAIDLLTQAYEMASLIGDSETAANTARNLADLHAQQGEVNQQAIWLKRAEKSPE